MASQVNVSGPLYLLRLTTLFGQDLTTMACVHFDRVQILRKSRQVFHYDDHPWAFICLKRFLWALILGGEERGACFWREFCVSNFWGFMRLPHILKHANTKQNTCNGLSFNFRGEGVTLGKEGLVEDKIDTELRFWHGVWNWRFRSFLSVFSSFDKVK